MSDYLADVVPCISCGERWCRVHGEHWADCSCPGPHVPDLAELDLESDITCQEDSDETILFWHRGLPTSDIALGWAMLEKAKRLGIGTVLDYT